MFTFGDSGVGAAASAGGVSVASGACAKAGTAQRANAAIASAMAACVWTSFMGFLHLLIYCHENRKGYALSIRATGWSGGGLSRHRHQAGSQLLPRGLAKGDRS